MLTFTTPPKINAMINVSSQGLNHRREGHSIKEEQLLSESQVCGLNESLKININIFLSYLSYLSSLITFN